MFLGFLKHFISIWIRQWFLWTWCPSHELIRVSLYICSAILHGVEKPWQLYWILIRCCTFLYLGDRLTQSLGLFTAECKGRKLKTFRGRTIMNYWPRTARLSVIFSILECLLQHWNARYNITGFCVKTKFICSRQAWLRHRLLFLSCGFLMYQFDIW